MSAITGPGASKPISKEETAAMVAQISESTVVYCDRIGRGIANDVFGIVLEDGWRLVLRILKNQTPDGVKREVMVQNALLEAGLRTPVCLPLRSGDVVGNENELAFTISEHIDGTSEYNVTDGLAGDFGRTLARFHRATAQLELDHSDWLSPTFIADELRQLDADVRFRMEDMLDGSEALFTSALPEANIHGDLGLENVFVEHYQIAVILDLETAERNVRLLDVAQSALALAIESHRAPIETGERILHGYETIESVTRAEWSSLPLALRYAAVACATWLFLAGDGQLAEKYLQIARSVNL